MRTVDSIHETGYTAFGEVKVGMTLEFHVNFGKDG